MSRSGPGWRRRFAADERKVKQILFNLLSNAVKFTPEGGSVTLSASKEDGRRPDLRRGYGDRDQGRGHGEAVHRVHAAGIDVHEEVRRNGARAGALEETRRAPRRSDLGRERRGKREPVLLHAALPGRTHSGRRPCAGAGLRRPDTAGEPGPRERGVPGKDPRRPGVSQETRERVRNPPARIQGAAPAPSS